MKKKILISVICTMAASEPFYVMAESAALEEVVVGAAISDDLIGAGEILQGTKVVGNGAGCGLEAGSLEFVGVVGLSGGV